MPYHVGNYRFQIERFFPRRLFDRLTELRLTSPDAALEAALARVRRPLLCPGGRLCLLAADHPGRMITAAAGDPLIMGDRYGYLGRILRVLSLPEWDGVLGSPDILEDLLLVDHLARQHGVAPFLDNRLLLGSMNRGGLSGTTFEMDDTFTAFDVPAMVRLRLDGAKAMVRIDPSDAASVRTLTACADAVTACARAGLPMFLEPLPVRRTEAGYTVDRSAEALVRIVGVASALGISSIGTWIKIPYTEGYGRVARATTCPILMLGGESKGDPSPVLRDFVHGIASAPNVRGVLVGRNVHHPGADDPFAVAAAVEGIVHEGLSEEEALVRLTESRDARLDRLTGLD
jgi:hypothetical protein